jgi:hypothetical protein
MVIVGWLGTPVRKGEQPPWIVPDGLWERIEPLLPVVPRRADQPRPQAAGQPQGPVGHPVCPVHGYPVGVPAAGERGFGSEMTCWRRLRDWHQAGVWQRLIRAVPPVRGRRGRPRRRPDAIYADRGYDHDKYRRQVRKAGITPVIARRGTGHGSGLGAHRWSSSRASPCCTGSGGCASAGRSATTSTRPSSASPAASSAGAG